MDYTISELYRRAIDAKLNETFAVEHGIDYGETIEAV